MTPPLSPPATRLSAITGLCCVLLVTAIMMACIALRVPGTNGAWYHLWLWQNARPFPLYPLMVLAALPFLIAQWIYDRKGYIGWALALLVLSNFAMQIAAISQQPLGFSRIAAIVENAINTGYYSAAKVLMEQQAQGITFKDWMQLFPTLMENYMMGHAKYKPPGLILYYMAWIRLLGPTYLARTLGGCCVGFIGSAGIATIYWLIRQLTQDRPAAFYAASYFALIPSLTLFFPQFDQAYVPIAVLLIGGWLIALRTGRPIHAVLFGLGMAMALFFTYTFLMLGVFLAVCTILDMGDRGRIGVETAIRQAIYATFTIAAVYLGLWIVFDFDALDVFQTASRLQRADTVHFARPFPYHMKMDVLDVIFGTGWISAPLIVLGMIRLFRERSRFDRRLRFAFVGVLQIGIAIGTAVFPGENARLLLPLMPLLMLPIGVELSRWPARYRLVTYTALWLLTVAICQNMTFLRMPGDGN